VAVMYEFQCRKCQKVFTELLDPHKDEVWHPKCECGAKSDRTPASFGSIGFIDWVNPDRGDGVNLGLGKHFKSSFEREDYAKSNGLEKVER